MIRFVYFDIDDTLLDHRKAEKCALADCHVHFEEHIGHHALGHIQDTYHKHNVPLWRDYGRDLITKEHLQRMRFEHLMTALDVDSVPAETLGTHYMERYAHHWDWIEGAQSAFHAIADRFPVGILTNGFKEIQRAKLTKFPTLEKRSASVVISEEVGVMKPNPRLFAHATQLAGVEPHEILYVGDSLHSDVEGGRNAGWQVAWFRGDADLRDNVEVFDDWEIFPSLVP